MADRPYRVYVVELDDRAGRRLDPDLPCVYIGETGKTPEERFQDHLRGGMTSNGKVRQYGVRLRPDLYRHLRSFATRQAALRAERELADQLKSMGYRVFGGQGESVIIGKDFRAEASLDPP